MNEKENDAVLSACIIFVCFDVGGFCLVWFLFCLVCLAPCALCLVYLFFYETYEAMLLSFGIGVGISGGGRLSGDGMRGEDHFVHPVRPSRHPTRKKKLGLSCTYFLISSAHSFIHFTPDFFPTVGFILESLGGGHGFQMGGLDGF